jgi:hypothetical protein
MMRLLVIDPGASGGLAWRGDDGIVWAEAMPDGMTAQIDRLRALRVALGPDLLAVVERVGCYMPGNSGPAAATFARHCGHIEAALYCLGVGIYRNPTPQSWQKALGTWPKDKMERKRAIKEWAARRYPHLSVTLKTADALALLAWGEMQEGKDGGEA